MTADTVRAHRRPHAAVPVPVFTDGELGWDELGRTEIATNDYQQCYRCGDDTAKLNISGLCDTCVAAAAGPVPEVRFQYADPVPLLGRDEVPPPAPGPDPAAAAAPEPAPDPDPPGPRRCGRCGYMTTAVGHTVACGA